MGSLQVWRLPDNRHHFEDGRRIGLPLSLDVLKSATVAVTEDQQALALE